MILVSTNISRFFAFLGILFLTTIGFSQEQISVDFSNIKKSNVNSGIASANLCWLLDSDKNNPNSKKDFAEAIEEMGIGSLWICDILYIEKPVVEYHKTDEQLLATVTFGYKAKEPQGPKKKPVEEFTTWHE